MAHPAKTMDISSSVRRRCAGKTFTESSPLEFANQWAAALLVLPESERTVYEADLKRRAANSGTWFDQITPRAARAVTLI